MSQSTQRTTRGTVRLHPTATARVVAGACLGLLVMAMLHRTAIAFVPVLAAAMVVDAIASQRHLARRHVTVSPLATSVMSPDPLMLIVDGGGTGRGLLFEPDPISDADGAQGASLLEAKLTRVPIHWTQPRAKRWVRYRLAVSYFGLVEARRYEVADFGAPVFLAPSPTVTRNRQLLAPDPAGQLREYVPGDRPSRISWATTARTGQLHVRDTVIGSAEATVVINLGFDGRSFTEMLSSAAGAPTDSSQVLLTGAVTTTLQMAATVIQDFLDQGAVVDVWSQRLSPQYVVRELERATEAVDSRPTPPEDTTVEPATQAVSDSISLIECLALAEIGPDLVPSGPHVEVSLDGIRVRS